MGVCVICALCGCQSAPEGTDINGIQVETSPWQRAETADSAGFVDSAGTADSAENAISEGADNRISMTTDNGRIDLDISNVSLPEAVYAGTLKKKTYTFEQFQDVFCPGIPLEEDTFGEYTDCRVEFNDFESDMGNDWKRAIRITRADAPYDSYSYTYFPLEQVFAAMDETTPEQSVMDKCEEQLQSYIDQLGTNYRINTVRCYGEETEKCYGFNLILTLNDIPCFKDGDQDIVITGQAQLSEDGLGSFDISEDFEIENQDTVDIISADQLPALLNANVQNKLINPTGLISISDVRLEYNISLSDGQYTFEPVWVMYQHNQGSDVLFSYAAFNAVNGELTYYSGM